MARALVLEEESGTCRGWLHPHNGYYAGNFSGPGNATIETASPSSSRLHLVPARATPSTTSTGGNQPASPKTGPATSLEPPDPTHLRRRMLHQTPSRVLHRRRPAA
jgi:hypothetical protein